MIIHRFLFWFLFLETAVTHAFPCYFTLAKGDCWLNYQVTVKVMDAATNKMITEVSLPQGKLWERQAFNCAPGSQLYYTASFSPAIWSGDEKKIWRTKRFKNLPLAPQITEAAWNIEACYPTEFAGLPIPSQAKNDCPCDFSKIPAPQLPSPK